MAAKTVSLLERLDEALELRPFPIAATRLITACNRADTTARDLSKIIQHDPALSFKLLQMANSPIYGFAGEIRSVEHATVVLGMRALRDLAISTGVADTFAKGNPESVDARKKLWLHSLACGTVTRALAKTIQMESPDEAFLAGVVHDVGKLFFFDWKPKLYLEVSSKRQDSNTVLVESDAFGVTHTHVGQKCGQNWGLPDELNDAICFHHTPEDADFGGELVSIVSAANQLSHTWLAGDDDVESSKRILAASGFDLDDTEISDLYESAMTAIREIQRTFA